MSRKPKNRPVSGGQRELAFSVTRKDLVIDTFAAGGPGGQHQNTSNTAVRITHPPSGATGEARDSRSQHQNMRAALQRLVASRVFQAWVHRELYGSMTPEERVERDMDPANLLIMAKEADRWQIIS